MYVDVKHLLLNVWVLGRTYTNVQQIQLETKFPTEPSLTGDILAGTGEYHNGTLLVCLCISIQYVHQISILYICWHQNIILLQSLYSSHSEMTRE